MVPPRDMRADVMEASVTVFSRYGYRKTTMNDIATEAGVARQSLYNLFPNKAAVVSATAIYYADLSIERIKAQLKPDMTLAEKLQLFCDEYVIRGYRNSMQTPDAKDLVDGSLPIDKDVGKVVDKKFRMLFISFLKPHSAQIKAIGLKIEAMAETIYCSLKGAKYLAHDINHLKKLNSNFINLVVGQLSGNN